MKSIAVRIAITPVAWQRPKTRVLNGFVKHYSPTKTKSYEQVIATRYIQETRGYKFDREQGLNVNLVFGLPIPKSSPKSKQAAMAEGVIRHTKRPDVDNLTKSILDALNGVAWEDDSQIVRIGAMKEYSKEPYVYLSITESID